MNPTTNQSIQRIPQAPVTKWLGTITDINIKTMYVQANLLGSSGPTWIKIAGHLQASVGTQELPSVRRGDNAIIERVNDQYIMTGWINVVGNQAFGVTPSSLVPSISAPTWVSIAWQGTTIYALWNHSTPNAVSYYELYSNSSPSPTGATLVIRTTGMSHSWNPQTTQVSNIVIENPGLESGGLNGYRNSSGSGQSFSVSTEQNHTASGSYSLKILPTAGGLDALVSNNYPVLASTTYSASAWANVTQCTPAANNDVIVAVQFSNLSVVTIKDWADVTSGWEQASINGTVPVGATWARIYINPDVGFSTGTDKIIAYLDDFSISAFPPINNYCAVRAIGRYGQSSSFTPWLIPNNQGAQTKAFQSQTSGALIGPEGIDGNLIPPGDKLSKYFFLQ